MQKIELNKILKLINDGVMNDTLSNSDLVQIIESAGGYLNLMTIPDYAKQNKISYNGAKKYRNVVTIFNTKYIIDND